MSILRDERGRWLNAWAERHVRERPGELFPWDERELWDKLDGWILDLSGWLVRSNHLFIDPVELHELTRDRVLRRSNTFRGDGPLTRWVFTIASRLLRTMLRQQKNNTSIDDEPPERISKELLVQPTAETEMLVESRNALLSMLLAQLSPRNAEIIRLIKIEGKSDSEVARMYEIEPGTVRGIVSRSLRFLTLSNQSKEGKERAQRAAS